jgi:hypothetical protein
LNTALDKYWPVDRPRTSVQRVLVSVVGQSGGDFGTDPNRFTTTRSIAVSRGVEQWAVGAGGGATATDLLLNLSTNSSTFSHYFSYVDTKFLLNQASSLAGLFCPQGNLCGSNCVGFCGCADADSCKCPTCTSSTCVSDVSLVNIVSHNLNKFAQC